MTWLRSSTVDEIPADPIGDAVAAALLEILQGATVELRYTPADHPAEPIPVGDDFTGATADGPPGWTLTITVRLESRAQGITVASAPERGPLLATLATLPGAGLRAAARFRSGQSDDAPLGPSFQRALRDLVVVELLSHLPSADSSVTPMPDLIEETLEYLVELSGSRVEAQDLTHGVIITDAIRDEPRLRFQYPSALRSAKRGPLLFDGKRSVLLVDRDGDARTELQRHRLDRLTRDTTLTVGAVELVDAGSLVATATRLLGGIGFFLRDDHSIWVFIDGRPLLMRRGEHWSAFPSELAAAVATMIGGGEAAELVVGAALIISSQRHGAILAIVERADDIDAVVSPKDRFDLRNEFDPTAMRVETRLHHLIDATEIDPQTLARLATLDGATVLDREANLLAYGAIVASADSQHEGARTAAAKTLSESALVVLKISIDGDITVFQSGKTVATLLGQTADD